MQRGRCVRSVWFWVVLVCFNLGFGVNSVWANDVGVEFYHGFVEVDGISFYCEVDGGKNPVVVLDAAYGKSHIWTDVLAGELRKSKAVDIFQYDRAGLGDSSISDKQRTPLNKAQELHSILSARGVTNFYYVGYALSGLTIRAYAYLYPGEIQGVLMLDCASEDQIEGIETFLNSIDVSLMESFKTNFINEDGCYEEMKIGLDQIRRINKYDSFRNIPLTVASGNYHGFGDIFESSGKSFFDGEVMEKKWDEWQDCLAGISDKSRRVTLDVYYCFQKKTVTRLMLEIMRIKTNERDYVDEQRFFSEGVYRRESWPLFRFFAFVNDGLGW